MTETREGDMVYRDGVPFFNFQCSGCVTGDYVDPDCPACKVVIDRAEKNPP